jgi:hypothetical protein
MPDDDWEYGLEALANHAKRTGQVGAAAAVRARGDRRRRNQQVVSGALGVVLIGALGAGIAFGQLGRPQPAPPAETPGPVPSASVPPAPTVSSSTSPTPPRTSTEPPPKGDANPVLGGDRQVFLLPMGSEATLGVGTGGRVGLSAGFGDEALFVVTPVSPDSTTYLIKTAKLREGGEASCLAVRTNGAKPMSVVTAACDVGAAAQLFEFVDSGNNAEGNPTFAIRNGERTYFVLDPLGEIDPGGGGLVAQDIGVETLDTAFLLVDQGKASLPNLD